MTLQTNLARVAPLASMALAALLAGCGGDSPMGGMDHGSGSTKSASSAPNSPSAGPTGTPASGPHNPADIAFAAGMIPHHAQAIEMSDVLLNKNDVEPAVQKLAAEIKAAQTPEIEQLRGWLVGWGQPDPTMSGMEGMDHSMDGGSMPGMMTAEQMTELKDASGDAARDLFLGQMIAHHRGAIVMAQMELADGQNADAKALAQRIIDAQASEITTMTELLAG